MELNQDWLRLLRISTDDIFLDEESIKRIVKSLFDAEPSVVADFLEALGHLQSELFAEDRRIILETCLLKSESNWVRDGAARGISYLDNPNSLLAVKSAVKKESNPRLKRYLERIEKRLTERKQEQES